MCRERQAGVIASTASTLAKQLANVVPRAQQRHSQMFEPW